MTEKDVQSATFLAQFPDVLAPIKASGDNWRIQLDIPKSEHEERKKLTDWCGVVLMVTVVPMKPKVYGSGKAPGRRKAKRRVVQSDPSL